MLSVPEAAVRTGKNPETIRRWIRAGKLRSTKHGTQHFVDETELDDLVSPPPAVPLPERLRFMADGRPMPDIVALVREIRDSS